ncbi:MAG: conjugal transfer protein TrbE [Syntrophorhabdales bacterium]
MYHLYEYQKHPTRLAHRLPWALLVAPGVLLNKPGSFQATIQFCGPDLRSSTEEELDAVTAQVNNALMRLGSGWAYFIEAQRRRYTYYPVSTWPTRASAIVDKERSRIFLSGDNFLSSYFLTFSYMPPSERTERLAARFLNEKTVDYMKHLDYFRDEYGKITDILSTVLPDLHRLDDDETMTYLHSCVSTKYHPVKAPENPLFLDFILTDDDVTGGLNPKLGESFMSVISIHALPGESFPQILKDLGSLPCEYRWSTRFISMDRQDAVREVKKYSRYWFAKRQSLWSVVKQAFLNEMQAKENLEAVTRSSECDEVAESIASGYVSAGYYTSCIVLWDPDPLLLADKASSVEQVINAAGFVSKKETLNGLQAWLGSLPGHCWANIRRPLVTSLNLCHLLPISADWPGQEKDRHFDAPPLFFAKTSGNTPFRFSLHVGDVGHAMVLGPTGSGKSALLSFIASQFLRYNEAQVYIFDKDRSAMVATYLQGGDHHNLGEAGTLSFQPLAGVDDESERAWALEWLVDIVSQEHITVTPKLKSEVWDSLCSLSTAPVHQRTLTGLHTLLQDRELRQAIEVYTLEGSYRELLDATTNSFTHARWQCFEMHDLMTYLPGAVAPVLTYLFHALERNFNGQPTLLILDECWLFLANPLFVAKIRDWLKTLRKKNACVVFATQSLSDLVGSAIFHTLIESCPTRIFLPNRRALEPEIFDQYRGFGLNATQIETLASASPKREYYCQSDLGSRLFELFLDKQSLAICASSSKQDLALLEELKAAGNNGLLQKFLDKKGVWHEEMDSAR